MQPGVFSLTGITMSPNGNKPEHGIPASKAARAWYDYMLRGKHPRVMTPWDEMTWFESPTSHEIAIDDTVEWIQIVDSNPMRVALIVSAIVKWRINLVSGPGFIDGSLTDDGVGGYTAELNPYAGGISFDDRLQWSPVFLRFAETPGSLDINGHPLTMAQPTLQFTQANYGPLAQCEVYGRTMSATTISVWVTEIILREFPRR